MKADTQIKWQQQQRQQRQYLQGSVVLPKTCNEPVGCGKQGLAPATAARAWERVKEERHGTFAQLALFLTNDSGSSL